MYSNLSTVFRRELRLNEVDKEIRAIWNSYNILQEYQDNKDQVFKELILIIKVLLGSPFIRTSPIQGLLYRG